MLLAATHTGLIRVADGSRPGEATWDLMGFAVAAPGTYVASGHPQARDPGPGLAGLLRSDDAGETWEQVSLVGQADFHALDADGDLVAGFSSADGLLWTSADAGRTWATVEVPSAVADLAVLPDDDGRLVLAAAGGVLLADADGQDLREAPGAPVLVQVSAGPGGMIVGAADDGQVHRSDDGGRDLGRRRGRRRPGGRQHRGRGGSAGGPGRRGAGRAARAGAMSGGWALLAVVLAASAVVAGVHLAGLALQVDRRPRRVDATLGGSTPREHALGRHHARWYAVALLFLVFDMEMVFMYPWVLVVADVGVKAVVEMFALLGALLVGVAYAWREGALRWA